MTTTKEQSASEDYFEFDFKPKGMKSKKTRIAVDGHGRPVLKWIVLAKDIGGQK